MELAELCARQLFSHYLVPPPGSAAAPKTEVSQPEDIRAAAGRYRKFVEHFKMLLGPEKADSGALQFFYRFLPTLYRAAIESSPMQLPTPTPETLRRLDTFLAGYPESILPFTLIDLAVKLPEQPLFMNAPHETPSLEIGMGDGYASSFLFPEKKATIGSDPLLEGMLLAKKRGRHEQYMAIDGTNIPFADNTFKTVFLVHSIDHVRDRKDVLKEVVRVLAPGGLVVLSDASHHIQSMMPLSSIYSALGMEWLAKDVFRYFLDFGGERVEFYSPDTYRQLLPTMGFEDVHVEYFTSGLLGRMAYAWFDLWLAINHDFSPELRLPRNAATRESFFATIKAAFGPLLEADKQLCSDQGSGLNMFVTARKRGSMSGPTGNGKNVREQMICPSCKVSLQHAAKTLNCAKCGAGYPIVDEIPLVMPCYADAYEELKQSSAFRDDAIGVLMRSAKKRLYQHKSLYHVLYTLKRRVKAALSAE